MTNHSLDAIIRLVRDADRNLKDAYAEIVLRSEEEDMKTKGAFILGSLAMVQVSVAALVTVMETARKL